MIVAHRGASRHAPENTIPAFKLAWESGADAIEGDFQLTRDGKIVCIHDSNTRRIAVKKMTIKEATLEELRTLDVGAWFGKAWQGTHIPIISEVLSTIPPGKTIYIEIKSGEEIIAPLFEEIEKSGLETGQIVVISFNGEIIRTLKAQAPQFKAFWLSDFKKGRSGDVTPSLTTILDTLERTRADGLSSTYKLIDESIISAIRAQGYEYHVWTIDDVGRARKFKRWGAQSITTNDPLYLRKHMADLS